MNGSWIFAPPRRVRRSMRLYVRTQRSTSRGAGCHAILQTCSWPGHRDRRCRACRSGPRPGLRQRFAERHGAGLGRHGGREHRPAAGRALGHFRQPGHARPIRGNAVHARRRLDRRLPHRHQRRQSQSALAGHALPAPRRGPRAAWPPRSAWPRTCGPSDWPARWAWASPASAAWRRRIPRQACRRANLLQQLNDESAAYLVLGINMGAGFQVTDRLSVGATMTLGTGFEQLAIHWPDQSVPPWSTPTPCVEPSALITS